MKNTYLPSGKQFIKDKISLLLKSLPDSEKIVAELQEIESAIDNLNESTESVGIVLQDAKNNKELTDLRKLYDFSPVGFFTLTSECEIIDINASGAKLLEDSISAFKKRLFCSFVAPDSKTVFKNFIERIYLSHTAQSCEVYLQINSDKRVYVQLSGEVTAPGSETCFVSILDATQNKEIADLNQVMLSSLPYPALYVRAADHVVLAANQSAIDFGFAEGEYCWSSMVHDSSSELCSTKDHSKSGVCDMCKSEACMTNSIKQVNHGFHAYGRVWDIFWLKINEVIFLHYFVDVTDRINADKAIRQSEKKYRYLFMHNVQPMFIFDLSTFLFLEVNDAAVKLYGFSRTEFKNLHLSDIMPAEDVPAMKKRIAESKVEGFVRGSLRHKKKNGELVFVEFGYNTIEYNGVTARHVTINDVSERVKTEQALRESEIRFSELAENTPGVVFQLYIKHTGRLGLNYVSSRVKEIFGVTVEVFTKGWTQGELIHPDDKGLYLRNVREAIAKQKEFSFEGRIITSKGVSWIQAFARPLIKDNQLIYNGIVMDITDRKELEISLLNAEWKFRALFEKGPMAVAYHRMIYDADGVPADYYFIDANEMYQKMTGVNPVGKTVIEAFPGIEKDPFDWIGTFGKVAKTGRGIRFEQYLEVNNRYYDCVGYQYKPDHFVAAFLEITERKLIEKALDESELALKKQHGVLSALIDNLPIGVFMVEAPSGKPLVANEEALKLLGRGILPDANKENLSEVYKSYKKFTRIPYPVEDMPIVQGMNGISTHVDDLMIIRPDGTEIQLEIFGTPVVDEHDGIWASLVSFSDITKRKQTEDALRDNEMFLKHTQQIAQLGTYSIDFIKGSWDSSDMLNKIYGIDPSYEKTFESWLGIIESPWQRTMSNYLINDVIGNHQNFDKEYKIVRPNDNETRWVHGLGNVEYNEKGEPVQMVGTVVDITQRKHEEEERNFLLASVENVPNRIVVKDLNLRVVSGNKSFIISKGENNIANLLGKTDAELFGVSEDVEPIKSYIEEDRCAIRLKPGEYIENELPVKMFDGKDTIASVKRFPIFDENGDVFCIGSIATDITERKKIESEILELNRTLEFRVAQRTLQLEESNKEIESFSYSVSHDLRAPLRHISGFSEMLSKEIKENASEKALRYLKTINDSAKQMGTLIDDLLDFSRTGRAHVSKSTFEMKALVDEAIVKLILPDDSRTIIWNIDELPKVNADYNLLRSVWINLLGNAIKYSRTRAESVINIRCTVHDLEYVFCVQDNGVGFDMNFVEKLFGVFQRLHSISEFEGTGIGLANVKRIISKHGGRTWAESELDKGASFYFSLPKIVEE